MDTAVFTQCVDSGKYANQVQNDTENGTTAGVQSTPTTFINKQSILGACPYSTFAAALEAELAGKKWSVTNCQFIES